MSKIQNNPIMKGASGMLGDVVVYRRLRGQVIMSNRPKKPRVITPNQERAKSRFNRAVLYAKHQLSLPEGKLFYQVNPESRFPSSHSAAVSDYLSKAKIHDIDIGSYGGAVGDQIFFVARKSFALSSVKVAIYGSNGTLLEQGDAVLQPNSVEHYVYVCKVANNTLAGTKIVITVRDRPGNVVTAEQVL